MQLRVEAYRAQEFLFSRQGKVIQHEDCHAVISPGDPHWFWGSFMIMDRLPQKGSTKQWEAMWESEYNIFPEIRHKSFCLNYTDGSEGDLSEFHQAGYEVYHSLTMMAEKPPQKSSAPEGIILREILSDEDWKKVTDLQEFIDREKYHGGSGDYKKTQIENFRILHEAGGGNWFGAFRNEILVADMGLFDGGKGTALIVFVETHPQWRRLGICTALTTFVLNRAFDDGYQRAFLVAMKDHEAVSIYQSCGMKIIEHTTELCLPPR